MRAPSIVILTVLLTVSGCATMVPTSSMDAEITGLYDPMETSIWVSSFGYHRAGIVSVGNSDPYIRANIDKSTGKVSFYQIVVHTRNYDWAHYHELRVMIDGDLRLFDVVSIDTDVSCYRGTCTNLEVVGARVPADVIRSIAAAAEPTPCRIEGRSAETDFSIEPGEASIVIQRVEEVLSAL